VAPERSYVNAGVCARRSGDMAGATEFFLLALKVRPNQAQALYQMADLSYARGDFGEAKGYLSRLTQVAPPTAEMLWLGVRVERRLGDRNSEASYALQLRNRFPNSREAQALLAGQYE
jgi:type IV pilus assembly protein PilF